MLCYPFEEKRLSKWQPPYLVQPKLDGERCRAIKVDNEYILLSSECNEFISVPHINVAVKEIGLPELDGELYLHGMNFNDIHSIVSRKTNIHENFGQMQYHIFDIVSEGSNLKRAQLLTQISEVIGSSYIKVVETEVAFNLEDVMRLYDLFIERGYEGIIVRNAFAPYVRKRSTDIMKFKPKKSDIYTVIGFKEEVDKDGNPKGRLGALICVSDESGETFSVGSGLTDEDRVNLWNKRDKLPGSRVVVAYQHMTSGRGVPRFPVFSKVIDNL